VLLIEKENVASFFFFVPQAAGFPARKEMWHSSSSCAAGRKLPRNRGFFFRLGFESSS